MGDGCEGRESEREGAGREQTLEVIEFFHASHLCKTKKTKALFLLSELYDTIYLSKPLTTTLSAQRGTHTVTAHTHTQKVTKKKASEIQQINKKKKKRRDYIIYNNNTIYMTRIIVL